VRLSGVRVAGILLLSAGVARAAGDYAVDSSAWNGLSALVSVAKSGGITVEARPSLAWSDLGTGDVLFILYPTARVDPVHLNAFLRGGGRALIADDFGRADEALARLGILRHPWHPGSAPSYLDNPNLPYARPLEDGHPLTVGVTELVTNHPSAFTVDSAVDPVFGYGKGEAVVVAGSLGNGRFVALSDPSVLINDMLAFDGNLAFAANLLRYLAPSRPARVFVVTGDAVMTGQPRDVADSGQPPSFNEAIAQIVAILDDLNDYLAPEPVLRAIAVLGGLGVLLVSAIILPLRRGRDPDGSFAQVPAEPPSVERLVEEYDDDLPDRNFAYPAAVLRENVEADLEARVQSQPANARGPTLRALELVRRLPPRTAVVTTSTHVSRKAFFLAHDAAVAALATRAPQRRVG